MQENECLVDQKEFFPHGDMTVFSITYCKSQHVDVITARSFYLIILFPSCFSVSHSLCWECAGILSKQEASVFPVWGHSLKKKISKHSFYCSTTHKEKLEKNGSGTAWASKNQFTKVAVTSLCTYWLVWKSTFYPLVQMCVNKWVYIIIWNI